jgi:L-histidine N-alpha-methyltransferase
MAGTNARFDRLDVVTPLAADRGATLAEDVLDGLTRPLKELPPKHLYDARGSELFEQICKLDEYYPTQTERSILEDHASEIAARMEAGDLVELGAGSATKTRLLLDALSEAGTLARYVPVDVSEDAVVPSARAVAAEYPALRVHAIVGDFERHLGALPVPLGPRLVAFLGGTIGNLPPGTRRRFLRHVGASLDYDGALLVGCDLVKDPARLEAAYDDALGVTAAFNLNLLTVLNRELGADFDPDLFEHVAFYDREHEWIEMRLRARERCVVTIRAVDLEVRFAAREELRTEISAKFTQRRLHADLASAGLRADAVMTDHEGLYAVVLARRLDP